jgi:hypothetical protein
MRLAALSIQKECKNLYPFAEMLQPLICHMSFYCACHRLEAMRTSMSQCPAIHPFWAVLTPATTQGEHGSGDSVFGVFQRHPPTLTLCLMPPTMLCSIKAVGNVDWPFQSPNVGNLHTSLIAIRQEPAAEWSYTPLLPGAAGRLSH